VRWMRFQIRVRCTHCYGASTHVNDLQNPTRYRRPFCIRASFQMLFVGPASAPLFSTHASQQ
jgi:hypothetical protein